MNKPKGVFLSAEWRKLIMFNYEVDAHILEKYVPKYTEIDFWNEKTYVSIVGFMFLNTTMLGLKIPFHINFEEVNLRFYVRRKFEEEWRRGVVFIREIVPRTAIATVANVLYNENYISLPMQHQHLQEGDLLKINYDWQYKSMDFSLKVEAENRLQDLQENSMEAFITEHYWGYAQGKKYTIEYQVEHPQWQTYPITQYESKGDFAFLYGEQFKNIFEKEPTSVLIAEGSEILVRKPFFLT
jgi:uncharacterized protein